MITSQDTIRCRPEAVAAEILDGEAMLINLETGVYYSLKNVGARIWQCIEQEQTMAATAQIVAAEYAAPLPQVEHDLASLVALLVEEHLVVVGPSLSDPAIAVPASTLRTAPVYESPSLQKFTEMADMLALDPPLPGLMDIQWKPTPKA